MLNNSIYYAYQCDKDMSNDIAGRTLMEIEEIIQLRKMINPVSDTRFLKLLMKDHRLLKTMTEAEMCVGCDKVFFREMESIEDSVNFHDIYCDECWREMSHYEL